MKHPLNEQQNDDIHITTEQHIADIFDEKISRYFVRNLWKLVGYFGYLGLFLGGLFFYQARVEHAQILNQIEENQKRIERSTGETDAVVTMLQIIESHHKAALNRAQIKNDKEEIESLQKVLDSFDVWKKSKLESQQKLNKQE